MTMRLTLPLPPNMANGRYHWRTKDRKRKGYLSDCGLWAALHRQPHPPLVPMQKARIRLTLHVWSMMDYDGAVSRCKWPVDWLVQQGYIADDKPSCLEWEKVDQVIDRKDPKLIIEIEEVG